MSMNNAYLARAKKMIPDPQILSVVAAKRAKQLALGARPMIKCDSENYLDQAFELERIPYVIMLGIFCGLVSLYFTRAEKK